MKNLLHHFGKLNSKRKGLTLIELLITISIMAVLAAVIGIAGYSNLERSRKTVCEANRRQLVKHYELDVVIKDGIDKSDITLTDFLMSDGSDVCPSGGVISVEGDTLKCSKHVTDDVDDNKDDDDDDGSVPYLFNNIGLDK